MVSDEKFLSQIYTNYLSSTFERIKLMMEGIYSLYAITLELIVTMNKLIAKLLEILAKKNQAK